MGDHRPMGGDAQVFPEFEASIAVCWVDIHKIDVISGRMDMSWFYSKWIIRPVNNSGDCNGFDIAFFSIFAIH
jgi:hypothetical protein